MTSQPAVCVSFWLDTRWPYVYLWITHSATNLDNQVLHQLWWKGVTTLLWGSRFQRHSSIQHGSAVFCYALSNAGTLVHASHWSEVFSLLKFDRISKKEKNWNTLEFLW